MLGVTELVVATLPGVGFGRVAIKAFASFIEYRIRYSDVSYSNRITSAIQLDGFVRNAGTRASRSAVAGSTPVRI